MTLSGVEGSSLTPSKVWIEDVTSWESQPRIVRKLAESGVSCQAALKILDTSEKSKTATLGAKNQSELCTRTSQQLKPYTPKPGDVRRKRWQSKTDHFKFTSRDLLPTR